MRQLQGAISGFGKVAEFGHLPAYRKHPEVRLVAVHEPDPTRRHRALRLIPGVRVYEDLGLMLSGERLDFLDIASPPALHADAAREALDAGVNVIIEKPACLSLDQFEPLVERARSRGVVLTAVDNWKHAPGYAAAMRAIQAGAAGPVRRVEFARLRTAPAGGASWRAASPAEGGGILFDHGWHVIYLARWFLGGAEALEVSAWLHSLGERTAEDEADLRIAFANDAVATAYLSWNAPVRRTVATIVGAKALIEIEDDTATLVDPRGERRILPGSAPSEDDSYHPQWFEGVAERFIAAVGQPASRASAAEEPRSPVQSCEEIAVVIRIIEAARESSRSGRPAVIPG